MSKARRIKREMKREQSDHIEVVSRILADLFRFLKQEPKPTDQEVRDRFISDRATWLRYCEQHKLTDFMKDLFVLNVESEWNRRSVDVTTSQSESQ